MEHITINSDRSVTVPVELRKIGVQYDHNVNTIEFVGPRYSSNVDLSTMTIYINYILSDKTPGKYKAENVIIDDQDDSLIRFNWTITRNVTKVSGILSCLVCAKKTDEEGNEINHWNTDIFRLLSVSEGMENDLVIQEQYPDIITSLIQNVNEHDAKLLEFSGLDTRVTDIENNVNEHDAKLLEFSGLDTRVTDIENNVNELKDDINNIENDVYSSESYHPAIYVDDMADAVAKTGWNVGSASGVIPITELSGYDSYYFVADSDYNLWFDILESTYVCVAHGTNFTRVITYSDGHIGLECTSPTRYRTTDNNLPTEANPLTVQAGDVLAFTFTAGTVTPFYGIQTTIKEVKLKSIHSGTFTKTSDTLTILTDKARYVLKKVTNAGINIDTWRLYSGELKRFDDKYGTSYFTMWANSDAEGVVQIDGESDFIGGYHGDEIMTNIRIFADGVDITSESSKTDKFDVISIYVESDVYHCNTSDLASTVAFKRNKWLKFEGEKVRIGNEWTAQSDLSIASAPLAMFQCYCKENEVEVATDYMANSDYKLYQLATPTIHTPNSKDNTEFTLETKINPIRFKSIKTNGANPVGVVAYTFISAQNRIKFYYYTIYNSTAITNGDKLISEFEFEIGR